MKRIMLLVWIGLLLFQPKLLIAQAPTLYPDPAVIQDLFDRVNTLRTRRRLPPYSMNAALNAAAQDQAEWLVATGRRSHVRPDGSRPSTRAQAAGYVTNDPCCGENYYMSIDATPDMVWNFWVWSSHHYINLVNQSFDEVGIGMSSDGYRHSYVMIFGKAPDLSAPTSTPLPVPDNSVQGEYVVQPGDTLLSIAQRFNMSVSTLAAANSLVNPELISSGQRLVLPGGTSVASAVVPPVPPESAAVPAASSQQSSPAPVSGQQTHVVQPGETLFQISLRYGGTMQAIMTANGLSNRNLIYVGQRLVIPPNSGAVVQSAASDLCSGFQATSPLDGFHNGSTTFYWDPAPGNVSGYRVDIHTISGQLVATFEADGGSTNVIGDMSANSIGSGLTFSWDVVALVNGQEVCRSQRMTALRENSAP